MALRVAYFGTYDPTYARNRVLIDGLRASGATVEEFDAPLPGSLSAMRLATAAGAGRLACELARAHMRLMLQHRRELRVDAVVVGYPGHLVVPFAWAMARYRRALLVFDPLVSLYDTFAGDRGLMSPGSAAGRAARAADRIAFGLPAVILADTAAHAAYFRDELSVGGRKIEVIPVGALPVAGATGSARTPRAGDPLVVLQYGKWSPLHGVETVLDAAAALADEPFRFVLAGEGQLSAALRDSVAQRRLANVELTGQLSAESLRGRMLSADICLGVFGGSAKAGRVIPNKVYDALATGRPLVTRDSPAARELLTADETALLVPPEDGGALAAALRRLRDDGERARLGAAGLALYRARCTPEVIGARLLAALEARR
jgi:glycosyltransferase involved in cell wall biosynthesis